MGNYEAQSPYEELATKKDGNALVVDSLTDQMLLDAAPIVSNHCMETRASMPGKFTPSSLTDSKSCRFIPSYKPLTTSWADFDKCTVSVLLECVRWLEYIHEQHDFSLPKWQNRTSYVHSSSWHLSAWLNSPQYIRLHCIGSGEYMISMRIAYYERTFHGISAFAIAFMIGIPKINQGDRTGNHIEDTPRTRRNKDSKSGFYRFHIQVKSSDPCNSELDEGVNSTMI
eukprot:Gb_22706 [translate_table: standard]